LAIYKFLRNVCSRVSDITATRLDAEQPVWVDTHNRKHKQQVNKPRNRRES